MNQTSLDIMVTQYLILFFLVIVLSIVVISYIMSISKRIRFRKRLWISVSCVSSILFYLIYLLIIWINVSEISIIETLYISIFLAIPIIILIWLLWFVIIWLFKHVDVLPQFRETELTPKISVFVAVVCLIVASSVPIAYDVTKNLLLKEEKISTLSEREKLEQYIDENVKGAIYIYNNKIGYQDITMVVWNNGKEKFDEVIFLLSIKNESYNLLVRNNGTDLKHSQFGDFPKKDTIANATRITWNEEYNFKPALGEYGYKFANFSLSWNISNKEFIRTYGAYISIHKKDPYVRENIYFANITDEPPIELIGRPPHWNIEPFWKQINEYQINNKSDW